jgi:hypothetical protein
MRQKMDDPKALALFQEILKKTLAGKMAWEPTAEDDRFIATLGKYTLNIVPYTSKDNWGQPEGPPVIRMFYDDTIIVEISRSIDGVEVEQLNNVFVFARRTALNADQKIDELLEELKRNE